MNWKSISKVISLATILYIIAFMADYVITLFSINETGVYISFFGLKLDMTITETELSTIFAPTPKIALTFVIWLILFLGCSWIISQIKRKAVSRSS